MDTLTQPQTTLLVPPPGNRCAAAAGGAGGGWCFFLLLAVLAGLRRCRVLYLDQLAMDRVPVDTLRPQGDPPTT